VLYSTSSNIGPDGESITDVERAIGILRKETPSSLLSLFFVGGPKMRCGRSRR